MRRPDRSGAGGRSIWSAVPNRGERSGGFDLWRAGRRAHAGRLARHDPACALAISIAAFYITDKPGEALAPVLAALAERARAGVTVRILLDESFMTQTRSSLGPLEHVPHLELRILPMTELTGGVLHAKDMVVDEEKVFVGSQNFDWRALDQIHEIGAEISDERFAKSFGAAGRATGNRAISRTPWMRRCSCGVLGRPRC